HFLRISSRSSAPLTFPPAQSRSESAFRSFPTEVVMKGKWQCLLIALALLLLGAGLAQAQGTGKIAGKVTRLDGTGLAGVTVRISSLDRSTQTDATGAYALDGVPPGTYEVTFTLSDHVKSEAAVAVAAGSARTLDQKVDWDLSFAETITVYS